MQIPEGKRLWTSPLIPFVVLVALAVLGLARWSWIRAQEQYAAKAAQTFAEDVAPDVVAGGKIPEAKYRGFLTLNPHIGYLALANYTSGTRQGVLNGPVLEQGGQEILNYRKHQGDDATLARVVQPGFGFAGEYLEVISVAFIPPPGEADRTPLGILKVAFHLPGYPFGRGFQKLWWGFAAIVGVVALLWGAFLLRVGIPQAQPPAPKGASADSAESPPDSQAAEDIGWLEKELDRPATTQVDGEGRPWRVLCNGENLSGWNPKGNWYLSDGDLCGQPWGASLISSAVPTDGTYEYKVRAKKVAGPDGFVVLFRCAEHSLAWILGGWKNTRSEVAGYSATRKEEEIETNEWYDLEIRVGKEKVEGFVNEQPEWELARSAIEKSSPDVGFQEGLGVATWSTLVKFQNPLFRSV